MNIYMFLISALLSLMNLIIWKIVKKNYSPARALKKIEVPKLKYFILGPNLSNFLKNTYSRALWKKPKWMLFKEEDKMKTTEVNETEQIIHGEHAWRGDVRNALGKYE